MGQPTISVIIPIYNCKQYISRCLHSIKAQNIDMEIIIINDASTDGLKEYLNTIKQKIKFEYIELPQNSGPAIARNYGIKNASSDYIAFLDADDWWENNKIKKQIQLIKNGADFTFTGRKNIYENAKEKIIKVPSEVNLDIVLKSNPITCSSVILEKQLAIEYPMTNKNLCEDYLTWIRIIKDGIIAKGVQEPLVNYQVRKHSLSSNKFAHAIRRYKTYLEADIPFTKSLYYSSYYIASKLLS